MNKIIILTLIIGLVFATSIASANAFVIKEEMLNDAKLYSLVQNSDQADLPIWSIDNFWEYDMSITLISGGYTAFSIEVKRMDIVVIDDDYEGEYTLELSGYLSKFVFNNLDYSPNASYVSGNAHIDKSTLSMKSFELFLSGNSPKINFDVVLNMGFDPKLDFLDFPIILNENQWNIATNMDITINGNIKFFGINIPVEKEFLDLLINDNLSTSLKEVINVEAGEFESFRISGEFGDSSNLWYSPEIGYLTKVDITKEFPLGFNFDCNLELLSTNFNHPEDNGAPNIPVIIGPDEGQKGEEYEYKVTTTDPENEQIYYKIDWGDGTCSDWIGLNTSGEEVITKHTWTSDATFNIRAKAKDVNGYQTAWSDPLPVTMPVSQSYASQSSSPQTQSNSVSQHSITQQPASYYINH